MRILDRMVICYVVTSRMNTLGVRKVAEMSSVEITAEW
jgi:hypothetical protein